MQRAIGMTACLMMALASAPVLAETDVLNAMEVATPSTAMLGDTKAISPTEVMDGGGYRAFAEGEPARTAAEASAGSHDDTIAAAKSRADRERLEEIWAPRP